MTGIFIFALNQKKIVALSGKTIIALARKKVIDIDELDKSIRDKVVLSAFDKLKTGEQLTIFSSYDPITLKRVFEKKRPGYYRWNYLKKDSVKQEIRITKHGSSRLTVNEIIALYPGAVSVFEQYCIAYYLKGNTYLSDISRLRGLKEPQLIAEIVATSASSYPEMRFRDWDIPLIIKFLIHNHHVYLRKTLQAIRVLISHVAEIYHTDQPEIISVSEKFEELSKELEEHLKEEEEKVFPAIRDYFDARQKGLAIVNDVDIKYSINWLKEDHIIMATDLKCLRDLCNNYIPPPNACPAYCFLYEELLKFEKDQHFHIYLENNILFSAAKNLLKPAD